MQSWEIHTLHCKNDIFYAPSALLSFNITCLCYTQCKAALDLLPGMKLNMLAFVSALLGKVVLWENPTCGKTLQFCFETSNRKVTKKLTQKCVSCRQLSKENGVLFSLSLLGGLIKDVISDYKTQPCLGWVGNLHTALLPCCSLTQEGKIGLCFQLMVSARWLCCWRGYLCIVRCIIFGNLLLQSDCRIRSVCHSRGFYCIHCFHFQCCPVLVSTDPPTAKVLLVSDHRQSSGSSVTVLRPGSSSAGSSKSGGWKSRVSNSGFQCNP